MNFKPSDKVVCVSDEFDFLKGKNCPVGPVPRIGPVYTVKRVGLTHKKDGVALVGSTAVNVISGEEAGYHYSYFRNLEEIQAESKLKREQEEAAALKEATQLINSEP